jgi:rsbT co-antagonist protein RsbR
MNAATYSQKFFICDDDIANIQRVGALVLADLPQLISDFYDWMQSESAFSQFFTNPTHLAHVKQMQQKFWQQFFEAKIDDNYIQFRYKVGEAHARIGLPLDIYYHAVNVFNNLFAKLFISHQLNDFGLLHSFQKFVSLDTAIVVDTYSQLVAETMRAQNQALMQLSTPITRLWGGILLLPLVGIIDSHRAQDIMSNSLQKIAAEQAKVFILDIGGVAVVDTAVANHLIKITKAAKLMGCICIISGISPAVAQTIVELGIQIDEISTTANMQDALFQALKLTGIVLTSQQNI